MKKYLEACLQNKEVKGAKILLAGRLGGADIARRESLKRGMLPLQTLRADIDYGYATAFTTYGTTGVKVWIYKGEVFEKKTDGS
ncbi:MAG: 30S ribosomal protein S3 [Parcubacteria group bacterium GW2011_GWB1_56_8]|nr:MAG: 30S ribosomal protein S3 [Parcubacteria group bacterium GW2011_GWB1_56_8]